MTNERLFQLRQSGILLFTALIWGVAFVAQSVGMDYIGPCTLVAVRFLLGALTLLPVIWFRNRRMRAAAGHGRRTGDGRAAGGRTLAAGGILCGIALGAASILQQVGISLTTVGKAGFLTALYIVIVPVFAVLLGRKTKPVIWLSVAVSCLGIYYLSMPPGRIALTKGDALCIACAFVYAVQILLIDHYVNLVDGVHLAAVQFLTASVIGAVLMLCFESPSAGALIEAARPVLYLGVMSSGVAYTLQIIGQRGLNPTIASLIMSLESTISVLAGYFLLHQTLSVRELAGCALMGAAIIAAQLA